MVLDRLLTIPTPGQTLCLENVNWSKFQQILTQLGEHRATRLAYDQGFLRLMAPMAEHEYYREALGNLVRALGEEFKIMVRSRGSVTLQREDLGRGVEPDQCFYIQNEAAVRRKRHLDLPLDPPPDLVIEVDYSHSSIENLPIYAALGVPELWHYDARQLRLQIYQLLDSAYIKVNRSPTFPALLVRGVPQALEQHETVSELQAWIQKQPDA